MAKHVINMIDKDKVENKVNESELINEISRQEFHKLMEQNEFGYNELRTLFDAKKICINEQIRFNLTIKKLKKETNISLTEMILFLEETFAKFNKILLVFDGENRFELKKELSVSYHIKLDKNTLSQILG